MRTYQIISADSHVNSPPDIYEKRVPAKFRDRAPRVVEEEGGSFWVYEDKKSPAIGLGHMAGRDFKDYHTADGKLKFKDVRPGGFYAPERLKDMDVDGMDAEVLYMGMVGGDAKDPELRLALIRAYNDWLTDYCNVAPDRLAGIAMLPTWDLELMTGEMRRAIQTGLKGWHVPAYAPLGGSYGDAKYDHLWSSVSELGYPASIHLGGRTSSDLKANPLPFIAATTIALAEPFAVIIFGGVLERHPKVKLICTEGGIGWWAYFLERMDNVYNRHRHWTGSKLPEKPSFYFHRNCSSTFQEDVAGVRLWDLIGADNIMWASDYPHTDTTWPNSKKVIAEHFKAVPAAAKRKMICENARALYFKN
jgi:predicted TIM-barrel fold metal-dependent hydrolase